MRKLFVVLGGSLALVALAAAGASAKLSPTAGPAAAGKQQAATSYIVVFKDDVSVDAKLASVSSRLSVSTQYVYTDALKGFAATLTAAQANALRADADVSYLQVNGVVHSTGVQPIAPGETVPPGVRRIESAVGGNIQQKASKAVAVIDTGVNLSHPDLNAVHGKDCVNAAPAEDDNGHGTHVAGTIAARNQGAGVDGISPDTKIYAVKVLDAGGSGTFAQVICGIDWVAAKAKKKKIKVANMSLGASGQPADDQNCGNTNGDAMHQAICNAVNVKKVVFVVSAGNDGANYADNTPAQYNEVLTVTAMTDTDGVPGGGGPVPTCFGGQADDTFATFSSWAGSASNDVNHTVAAPGVCVLSTWLGGGYNTISGTSMASPHVAGTVANCFGHAGAPGPCAGMTPAQVIAKIRADAAAKPVGYGFGGDPNHAPPAGRYYGLLVSNLGY